MSEETPLPPKKEDKRNYKAINEKMTAFSDTTAKLVYMMQGDENYLNKKWAKKIKWEDRTKLVTEMMENLKDPQFMLVWNQRLLLSNKTALNQGNGIIEETEEVWPAGESKSMNEEFNQIMAILEQTIQPMTNWHVYVITGRILQYLADSCTDVAVAHSCTDVAAPHFLNQYSSSQVEGSQGVGSAPFEREKGQLTLNFPSTLVNNQEMINEEQQQKELTLTIRSVAGRVTQLKLAKPEMLDPLPLIDEGFDSGLLGDNYKCNADCLKEIFNEYPSLAGTYAKIKRELEKLDQKQSMIEDLDLNSLQSMMKDKELDDLQLMIQDMELNGLKISWLKTKLTEVRERKTLLEQIVSKKDAALKIEQDIAKYKQQLDEKKKKQRI